MAGGTRGAGPTPLTTYTVPQVCPGAASASTPHSSSALGREPKPPEPGSDNSPTLHPSPRWALWTASPLRVEGAREFKYRATGLPSSHREDTLSAGCDAGTGDGNPRGSKAERRTQFSERDTRNINLRTASQAFFKNEHFRKQNHHRKGHL